MGIAEILGFAICWLLVATVMLWGVFTEHKRGGPTGHSEHSRHKTERGGERRTAHPSEQPTKRRPARPAIPEWVLIEALDGSAPEIADQARFLGSAWLVAQGVDAADLGAGDLRTEVTSSSDGTATTRILVRGAVLEGSRHHH